MTVFATPAVKSSLGVGIMVGLEFRVYAGRTGLTRLKAGLRTAADARARKVMYPEITPKG